MEQIGIRELRQHASRHLERVKAGESLQVTDRGVPVAILSPVAPVEIARQRMIDEGRLIPAKRAFYIPVGRPSPTGTSTSTVLDEDRSERL